MKFDVVVHIEADRISFPLYVFGARKRIFYFSAFYFSADKEIRTFVSFPFSVVKRPRKQKRLSVLRLSQCTAGRTLSHMHVDRTQPLSTSLPAEHEYLCKLFYLI